MHFLVAYLLEEFQLQTDSECRQGHHHLFSFSSEEAKIDFILLQGDLALFEKHFSSRYLQNHRPQALCQKWLISLFILLELPIRHPPTSLSEPPTRLLLSSPLLFAS